MKTIKEEIEFIVNETEGINTAVCSEQVYYNNQVEKIYGKDHKNKVSEEDARFIDMLGRLLQVHTTNYQIMLNKCNLIKKQSFDSLDQLHDSKIYMQWHDIMTLCLLNTFQFREQVNLRHIDMLTGWVDASVGNIKHLFKEIEELKKQFKK